MSFITYGQKNAKGIYCTCKAICVNGCVCDCVACEIRETVQATNPTISPSGFTQAELEHWTIVEQSTNISAYRYDDETKELQVVFKDKTHGCYFLVEPETFEELQKAKSKGQFFAHVVAPNHRYQKQGRIQ